MSSLEIQERLKKEKLMNRLQQVINTGVAPEGHIPFLRKKIEKLKFELEGF